MTQFREFTTVQGHRVFVDCTSVLLVTDGVEWKGRRHDDYTDGPLTFVCLRGSKEPLVVRGDLADVVLDIERTANKPRKTLELMFEAWARYAGAEFGPEFAGDWLKGRDSIPGGGQ